MSDRGTDAKFSGERVHMEAAHPWQDVKFLHFFLRADMLVSLQ